MRTQARRQFKLFPYAHPYKKVGQMWSSLLKISKKQKRMYTYRNKFFSMEYRRPLPKSLLWPMTFSGQVRGVQQTQPLAMEGPWLTFRVLFFAKLWMLKNPALVPGVVWPVKSKKYLLAKMHAFQGLTDLTGKASQGWTRKILQKLWSLRSGTRSSLWSVTGGLDSLFTNLLLKSGWTATLPRASHLLTYKKVQKNGVLTKQSLAFAYPGDYVKIKDSLCLLRVLNAGPEKDTFLLEGVQPTSIHALKLFGWLRSFYGGSAYCNQSHRKGKSLTNKKVYTKK